MAKCWPSSRERINRLLRGTGSRYCEAGAAPAARIRRAFALALGRGPTDDEIRRSLPVVREHGLTALCRVLFNTNEFVFLQ